MPTSHNIKGTLQHYAWGGHQFLPNLLHQANPENKPTAEYWLGDHPKSPSTVAEGGKTLPELIRENPVGYLGQTVVDRFGARLPFLFKVLDVKEMLSIQVHPTKAAAEAGFAAEEASGPDRTAPNRNYRDDNHKPELGVALTDFYLLHGFKSKEAIAQTLAETPGWAALQSTLTEQGVKGLYEKVMTADQETVDGLLQPLIDALPPAATTGPLDPAHWAHRAVELYTRDGHHDRGIFSIYWYNIVHLEPGQGIFQNAGIPHAYLRGSCMELMANSDNVLRAGLTPKHIDVPELLKHLSFEPVTPEKLTAQSARDGWAFFPTPVPDFRLFTGSFDRGQEVVVPADGKPSIVFLLDGEAAGGEGSIKLNGHDRAIFVPAGEELTLTARADANIYRATVGDL